MFIRVEIVKFGQIVLFVHSIVANDFQSLADDFSLYSKGFVVVVVVVVVVAVVVVVGHLLWCLSKMNPRRH